MQAIRRPSKASVAARAKASGKAPNRTRKAGAKGKPAGRPAGDKAAARQKVQDKVLAWYDEHGRQFPWRDTRDPYRTLVAETMLQQTQTGRVVPTFQTFVQHYPTLDRLAHAPSMDVIRAWRGLGYNRRAVELHEAAQAIEHDHGGVFPRDPKVLKRLPGVGEYTASAVACFAFDEQVPVVDTNVRRTLSRTALGKDADAVPLPKATAVAAEWLPDGEAYRWNQAIMDLGAMVCRPDQPLCSKCPLRTACLYYAKGLHKRARPRTAAKGAPFEGSNRQKRGGIVDHLRDAAQDGVTLSALAKALHPDRTERDLGWLVELLEGLERDGLVALSAAARRGSARGTVRLPG